MIYVVGRGRVGSALTEALPEAIAVAGRGFSGITALTADDVVVLSVPDAAVAQCAAVLAETPAVVLHCAGAVPLSALGQGSRGVFYPMVSFRSSVAWNQVPVFAEASDERAADAVLDLAQQLGCPEPRSASSEDRARYHLGAVFANNFSNHVVALLQAYCAEVGLDASVYRKMLVDTVHDAVDGDAQALQTGPAARGDRGTVALHLERLPEGFRAVYQALSESIERHAQ
jgi:predicted short-subunit dehydrogenase-like oxidoreductase (DUF2520 family)